MFEGIESPLRGMVPQDIDMVVVRENNEGEYSEIGGRLHQGTDEAFRVIRDGLLGEELLNDPKAAPPIPVEQRRALYPNGSRYRTTGLFAQNAVTIVPDRLRALLGGR